jgi:hypothetical protein
VKELLRGFVSKNQITMTTKKRILTGVSLIVVFITLSSFDLPVGWYRAGMTPKNYDMGIDKGAGQNGTNAGTMKSIEQKVEGWGTLMQDCSPEKFLGKKIRMSAFMKTKDLKDKATFWLRVDQANSNTALSFDNMMKRPIKGTTDWTKYEIILDVPSNASNIAFGAMLVGGGQIWFDNFNFEVVGDAAPAADNTKSKPQYNNEPTNLDFEK